MSCCKNDDPVCRLIYFTAQDMKNFAEKILSPYDFTIEQLHLLKHMSTETALSQRELGAIANKTAGNMTRILDRLEAKELIERRDNPQDRRASLVFLTAKGRKQVEKALEVFNSFTDTFLKGVSKEEEQVVRTALSKIQHNIQQMSEKIFHDMR